MKLLLSVCLLVMLMPSVAVAQRIGRIGLTRTQIKEAESRLSEMGYWTGAVDGIFDSGTQSALIAFQKWEARSISGELTMEELEAIRASRAPRARETGYEHAEVDLDRQVLLWVNEAGGVKVLPVSTGTGERYLDEGQESLAYTPRGRFLVYDKGFGWEKGPLGSVYYPNGISGGIAIHGSRKVPNAPASHGCIRIPMFAAREVSKLLKLGTIVLVYDKVSFVSAKDWVKNPKLKEAALVQMETPDYTYETVESATRPRVVIKKARPRIIRA